MKKKKSKSIILLVSTIICLLIILWSGFNFYININHVSFSRALKEAEKVDYNDFRQLAFDGEVDSVYYQTNNQYMVFTLYNEDTKGLSIEDRQKYNYPISNYRVTYYPAGDTFRSEMLSYGVNLVLVNSGAWNYILRTVLSLIPSLVILIGWIWFMVYMTKNQFGSKEDDLIVVNSDTKFEDIIGHDELIEELKLITNLIKGSIKDSSLKVKVPKGILFSGPSGTGKTMLARAIANEAGVTFLQTSGSDFKEIYVGSGARKIRSIFKIAREHAPCIVFIDEIESIGTKRDSFKGNSEDTQTINALLKEMDGFNKDDNIFILAATNNPEKLDAAIKRSGRFDREIVVPPPRDWRVRKKLFLSYLKDNKISDDVDLDTLSKVNEQVRKGNAKDIALLDEALHEKRISRIADQIAENKNVKMVLIAGPSSSGKTTFAQRLGLQLKLNGLKPVTISVDDYFVEREDTPKDENGNFDFECIEAIDLPLFNKHISA